MTSKSMDLLEETRAVVLDPTEKAMAGFLKVDAQDIESRQFAKALASAFLKFTREGNLLSQSDSVQNFMALSNLHQELTAQAHEYLRYKVTFVTEDQPLHPLLLGFAAYRLELVNKRYQVATLQNLPGAVLTDLRDSIRDRQAEVDNVLQLQ